MIENNRWPSVRMTRLLWYMAMMNCLFHPTAHSVVALISTLAFIEIMSPNTTRFVPKSDSLRPAAFARMGKFYAFSSRRKRGQTHTRVRVISHSLFWTKVQTTKVKLVSSGASMLFPRTQCSQHGIKMCVSMCRSRSRLAVLPSSHLRLTSVSSRFPGRVVV